MPDEVLSDLNGAIFVMGEKPDTFKKNLQSTYVQLLIDGFNEAEYDDISKAAVYSALKEELASEAIHALALKTGTPN
mgnify:FL=1